MTPTKIIFKQNLSETGNFESLSLIQGENEIVISFAPTEMDSTYHSNKWENVKKVVDALESRVKAQVEADLISNYTVPRNS